MYSPAAMARAQAIQAEMPNDKGRDADVDADDESLGGRCLSYLSDKLTVRSYLPASSKTASRFRH